MACAIHLNLSRFNHRLAACEEHPDMMKGAAACHLSLQRSLKGGDKGRPLVYGHSGDLQERERDCRAVPCPPAIAGATGPRGHRGPQIGINSIDPCKMWRTDGMLGESLPTGARHSCGCDRPRER